VLKNFIDYNTGKILNLRQAGLKAKVIRKVKRAIKRSRAVGLMPFTTTVNH
jgi:ribosomal protein S18